MDYTKIKLKDIKINSYLIYILANSNTYVAEVKDYQCDENGEYIIMNDLLSLDESGWLSNDLRIPQEYIDRGRFKIIEMVDNLESLQERYPEQFI